MSICLDPEGNEISAFIELAGDLQGKRVLEIGCGDGRLTWLYGISAAHIDAIDPDADDITQARQNTPPAFRKRVSFKAVNLEQFWSNWNRRKSKQTYDLVILSWSL